MKRAIVLLSGGLDSTTVLAHARSQNYECYALSFNYGQRTQSELDTARYNAQKYGAVHHKIIDLSFLGALKGSVLTDHTQQVPQYQAGNVIPDTYVPARNTLFLSIALGFAETVRADAIFIGASQVDYSGYPDCRAEYFHAFQNLTNLATKYTVMGNQIKIQTPLLNLSKAQTIKLGLSLGVDYAKTITCYDAKSDGAACGSCDSCVLRKIGFQEAGVLDPTYYNQEQTEEVVN